jgi:hypothetical protein
LFKISKRAVIGLAVGALALTGLGLAGTASAAPAPGTASAPSNVVTLPANVRVPGFSVPNGGPLFNGHDVTVQATGAAAGLADPGATAVLVKVTAFNPTGTGQLVAHATGTGAPGNPTVAYTKGSENSGVAWVKLDAAGTFVIEEEGAATHALVEIDAESVLPAAPTNTLAGAYYSVAKYDLGDTNGGAIATVACKAKTDTAISGGVQTIGLGSTPTADNVPISSSFPGREDFTGDADNNKPIPGRTDGWIVQFGGNSSSTSLGDPKFVNVYALCVPGLSIPVDTTFTESGS